MLFGPSGATNLGMPPVPFFSAQMIPVDTNGPGDALVFWAFGSSREYWVNRGGLWGLTASASAQGWNWESIDDRGRLYGTNITPGGAITEDPPMLQVEDELVRLETLIADTTVEGLIGSPNMPVSDHGTIYLRGQIAGAVTDLMLFEGAPCLVLEFGGFEQASGGIDISADPGNTIPFVVRGGLAGDPVGLFYRLGGGAFSPLPFFVGAFDAEGEAGIAVTAPASLQGLSIDFLALALDSELGVLDSVVRTVNF